MDAIQMVDLKKQYKKIKKEVDKAIIDVVESAAFINGKPVQEFAENLEKYLGVKHVIPCANGTDALQIALMALGLKPGDEVITPSFTFIATTEVVALLRLKPVFVDVDPDTFCMDPKALEAAITPQTKVIIPVHLYGQTAPMLEIMEIANRHNLFVVEDNAQAIGGDYFYPDGRKVKSGTIGHIGCTSFFPSKNLGCYGDGGAMFTNDEALALTLKKIANHGQDKRYYHEMVGCNSRLDTIQASILKIKLGLLDEYINARRDAADYYDQGFIGIKRITVPFRPAYCRHVFHQYTLKLEGVDRDGLVDYLASFSVPAMIYYPVPAHRQQMFAAFGGTDFQLPVTDALTGVVVSLPIHTELEKEQQDFIISKVLEFVNR